MSQMSFLSQGDTNLAATYFLRGLRVSPKTAEAVEVEELIGVITARIQGRNIGDGILAHEHGEEFVLAIPAQAADSAGRRTFLVCHGSIESDAARITDQIRAFMTASGKSVSDAQLDTIRVWAKKKQKALQKWHELRKAWPLLALLFIASMIILCIIWQEAKK